MPVVTMAWPLLNRAGPPHLGTRPGPDRLQPASRGLYAAAAYDDSLAGEILVIFYERGDEPEFELGRQVTAISMAVPTITQ